jgi:hypothetical protein
MTNTSKYAMLYICVQAKEGSLEDYTATDAEITERENKMFFEWSNHQ